ncbi:hypothetical protein BC828DRAFT_375479 [Blastocladiella britannica]|nr:hypothetical protein BC828DRAFT_375479 [Blastocladiella britannica]
MGKEKAMRTLGRWQIALPTPQPLASQLPPAPPVVLLGWWHSDPRHVQKYVAHHQRRGSTVLYTTLPAHCVTFPLYALSRTIRALSDDLYRAADARLLPMDNNGGATLHAFSGNGGYTYALMNQHRSLAPLIGRAIYDCVPPTIDAHVLATGSIGMLANGPMVECVPAWTLAAARAYLAFPPHARLVDQLSAALLDLPVRPALVMGGGRDRVVTPDMVREFARTSIKARNAPLAMRWFETAGHVELYRRDPERYNRYVDEFVRGTLPMTEEPFPIE